MNDTLSLLVAAELSDDAYPDGGDAPSGWTPLAPSYVEGSNSFTVFIDAATEQIVFACKGTSSIGELESDLTDQGGSQWENIRALAQKQ